MPLTVTSFEKRPGVYVVSPVGSLDTHTYATLDKELNSLISKGGVSVVSLDLRDLHYISSAGIRSILTAKRELSKSGGALVLSNLQPQIVKVFEIIRAIPSMSIFESVEELDSYLDQMQRRAMDKHKP